MTLRSQASIHGSAVMITDAHKPEQDMDLEISHSLTYGDQIGLCLLVVDEKSVQLTVSAAGNVFFFLPSHKCQLQP